MTLVRQARNAASIRGHALHARRHAMQAAGIAEALSLEQSHNR